MIKTKDQSKASSWSVFTLPIILLIVLFVIGIEIFRIYLLFDTKFKFDANDNAGAKVQYTLFFNITIFLLLLSILQGIIFSTFFRTSIQERFKTLMNRDQ